MPQHSQEAFKPELYPDKEEKPDEKKKESARIFDFPSKKERTQEEIGQGYDKYKNVGGILSSEEYQDVLKRAADGTFSNSKWFVNAHSMTQSAGIPLSSETATIYGILRDEKPDPVKEHYSEKSDQELLAEALRIVGDESSLSKFIENYPHIFN